MAIFFHGNHVLKLCKWSKMMGIFIYFQLETILKEYQGCSVMRLELNISQCCSLCSYFCTAFPLGRLPTKWKIHYGISVFPYLVCIDINDCYASSLPERVTHANKRIDFCWNCIYKLYITTGHRCKQEELWKKYCFVVEVFHVSMFSYVHVLQLFLLFLRGGRLS